jgi:SAM-dependent methyltransferase
VFSLSDYQQHQETFFPKESRFRKLAKAVLPKIYANHVATRNYEAFVGELLKVSRNPRILIIGCGELGEGMRQLIERPEIELVETDVAMGSRTAIVCDCHDLPFEDAAFDGVILQAVLEHVVDPQRCVMEIRRCLRGHGLVYAETPFMQQVHGGRYDFVRFTFLGHRRLFRDFEEIKSGLACGPGMALAWSIKYFFWSFVSSTLAREVIAGIVSLGFFWLKYLDRFLLSKPAAFDGASANFFLGRKSDKQLSDRELLSLYRGARP